MFDPDEFEQTWEKYREEIYKFCNFKLSHDDYLTDETMNDICTVLYQKWDTIDREDNLQAYLYRVAAFCIKRTLYNKYRYYRNTDSLEEILENINPDEFPNELKYDDEYFGDFPLEEYIEQVKNALPEEYRDIFTYRYLENHTIEKVGELLGGVAYSTVRLRLTKIDDLVRDEIKKILKK